MSSEAQIVELKKLVLELITKTDTKIENMSVRLSSIEIEAAENRAYGKVRFNNENSLKSDLDALEQKITTVEHTLTALNSREDERSNSKAFWDKILVGGIGTVVSVIILAILATIGLGG